MSEHKVNLLGIENIRLTKGVNKVVAFVDVIVPTHLGDMTIKGFKVVQGERGKFVSFPSRQTVLKGGNVIGDNGEILRRAEDQVKYYNNIHFQEKNEYNIFKKALDDKVISAVEERISRNLPKEEETEEVTSIKL